MGKWRVLFYTLQDANRRDCVGSFEMPLSAASAEIIMVNIALILITTSLVTFDAMGCINKAETSKSGKITSVDQGSGFDVTREWESTKDKLKTEQFEEKRLRNSTDFKDRNDYAVALIYTGRIEQAISLLLELEMEKPGIYYVASNLGTAYELAGNNGEALRWIREAIVRNPGSHKGTEWLHVNILEAKIKTKTDPGYLMTHTITGVNYGKLLNPNDVAVRFDDKPLTVQQVYMALEHQLEERVSLVPAPDAVVASLLMELAQTMAITKSLDSTTNALDLAAKYGYPAEQIAVARNLFDGRLAAFHKTEVEQKRLKVIRVMLLMGSGITAIFSLIVYRKRRARQMLTFAS
ncbi:MAG: hypothetical protein JWM04_1979 [Verrucomicrobiales bacterium]|nr:hypothetical protein [Verrucomicrobiales bacterium]